MAREIALVTGGSSGIGLLTTKLLAREKYHVYVAALDDDFLRAIAEDNVTALPVDVCNDEQVQSAVQNMLNEHGHIDLLVNGASFAHPGAVEFSSIESVKKQFDVNVVGYARFMQAVLPGMRERRKGRIINISSGSGIVATPAFGWYAATKFAIEGVSDALRLEVEQFGIDIVLIEPGVIKTPFLEKQANLLAETPHHKDYESVVNSISMMAGEGTGAEPSVVAEAIYNAAVAKKPATRIVVPKAIAVAMFLKRFISDRMCDRLLKKQFNI